MGKHCRTFKNKYYWITEIAEIICFVGAMITFYLIGLILNMMV